jgi:hypothetical protein
VGDHAPIGERVARPGRGLGPVGGDGEAAAGLPADVTGVHEQLVAPGDLDAVGGADVAGVAEE